MHGGSSTHLRSSLFSWQEFKPVFKVQPKLQLAAKPSKYTIRPSFPQILQSLKLILIFNTCYNIVQFCVFFKLICFSLLSNLCIFWQYLASSSHLRYLTLCCWFSCPLSKLPICSRISSICSHLIKMSTKIQIRFQANGSSLCLHSSDSIDTGVCKLSQHGLCTHCSHLQLNVFEKTILGRLEHR